MDRNSGNIRMVQARTVDVEVEEKVNENSVFEGRKEGGQEEMRPE